MRIFSFIARVFILISALGFCHLVSAVEYLPPAEPQTSGYESKVDETKSFYLEKKSAFQTWYATNNKRVDLIPGLVNVQILDFLLLGLWVVVLLWILARILFK